MKKIMVLLVIITFFTACEQEKTYNNIPTEQKTLLVYNDSVYFQDSLTTKIDTFRTHIDYQYRITDGKRYDQQCFINYWLLNKKPLFKRLFIFEGVSGASISIDKVDIGSGIDLKNPQNDIIRHNVSVNGVIYPTIYIVQNKYDNSDSIPNTVYYSFQYGVVRYDYYDGRKYELINK